MEEEFPPKVDLSNSLPNFMPADTVVKALVEVANNNSYEIHQYTRARVKIFGF